MDARHKGGYDESGSDALRNGQQFLIRLSERVRGDEADACEKREKGVPLARGNNAGELEPPSSAGERVSD